MFSKLMEWIRQQLDKILPQNTKNTTSNVLISSSMVSAIELWSLMYNDKAPWLSKKKEIFSLNLPASITSELARLTVNEFKTKIAGSPRADYLDSQYQKVIEALRIYLEYGLAKGGLIIKPYFDGNQLAVDFIQGDAFFPASFDSSGRITACIFTDKKIKGKSIYTRFESHVMDERGYTVSNTAYISSNAEILGRQIDLVDVPEWAELAPVITLSGVQTPLFAYFKVPQANRIDNLSPLGPSVFAGAVDLIRKADEQYSRILLEFKLKEVAIDASADMFKIVNGVQVLPEGKERLFRKHDISLGVKDSTFFEVFSPEIRDSSFFNGLNKYLQRIEFLCGLAYGTLSDAQAIEKTATEIIASKQRSYSTVSGIQTALQKALEDLIKAMDYLTTLYKLSPTGNYEVSFNFDDSIITDAQMEQAVRMQEVGSGIVKPEEYLKWRYGVTEEQAKQMMPAASSTVQNNPFGKDPGTE